MDNVTRLDWDSDFFGYSVGKIEIDDINELPIGQEDYRLTYIFSKKRIPELEEELVDQKATFFQELNIGAEKTNLPCEIVEFKHESHSYEELLKLTYDSGVFSRFNLDKKFDNQEYEKLYKKWIDNSLNSSSNYKVYVAFDGNNLLGFITLGRKGNDLGDLGLLAVSPKARGRGIAKSLIEYCKIKSTEMGFNSLQVVTQLNNSPATKLYENAGFYLKDLIFIYHIWNHDTI